jgi:hypothetical protein
VRYCVLGRIIFVVGVVFILHDCDGSEATTGTRQPYILRLREGSRLGTEFLRSRLDLPRHEQTDTARPLLDLASRAPELVFEYGAESKSAYMRRFSSPARIVGEDNMGVMMLSLHRS